MSAKLRIHITALTEDRNTESSLEAARRDRVTVERIAQCEAVAKGAEAERDAAVAEAEHLRRELRSVREKLLVLKEGIQGKDAGLSRHF